MCPSGCGAELALRAIPRHDCVKDLKYQLKVMETRLQSNEGNIRGMDAHDREGVSQESKTEQVSAEIRELLNERSRQDEIFNSKEVFYKEQLAVLREQVVKLESKLQGLHAPEEDDARNEHEQGGSEVKEWIFKYEQLLADKIGMEELFHKREREYQQEINALRAETSMLQQNLHLERKILSLEHDQAACQKLETLTDQLEELVKQKQHEYRKRENGPKNGRVRHRIPNSVGSWTSEISEVDEEDTEEMK